MLMSTADRATAIVLAALGLAMAVGGYRMDRLEIRQIHPASIPGLVPMILGVLMVLCAALLWRAAAQGEAEDAAFVGGSWTRLGTTAAICLTYALVLVGWLPFFWATAIFVAGFAAVFAWPEDGGRSRRIRSLAFAAVLGIGIAAATSVLFAEVFLVRLP